MKRKWIGALTLLVLGVGTGTAGATMAALEVWNVRSQLSRQSRIRAIVEDAGLPREFIPKIRSDDRRVLGGISLFGVGLLLAVAGAVRIRDVRRQHLFTLGESPQSSFPVSAKCLPGGADSFPLVRAVSRSPARIDEDRADYLLAVTPSMSGHLELEHRPRVSFTEAIEEGLAAPSETALGAYEVPIVKGLRAKLSFGDADFLISTVPAAVPVGAMRCPTSLVCDGVSAGVSAIRSQVSSRRVPHQSSMRITLETASAASVHIEQMREHLEVIVAADGPDSLERAAVDLSARGRLPRLFFQQMEAALAEYDRYIETVIEKAPLGVTCSAGCSACCHGAPTGVRACELLILYRSYRRFPDFRDLHNRAVVLSDQLMEDLRSVSPRTTTTVMTDSRAYRRAYVKYMKRRNPCVFVDPESGLCRVYEARPISCRMHFSLSEPGWCWPDSPMASKAVTPNLAPPPVVTDLLDQIDDGLGLRSVNRILLPGLTYLGRRVLDGKPLRSTGRVADRSGARSRRRRKPRQ